MAANVIDVIQDVEQLVERSEEDEIIERLKESSGGRGERTPAADAPAALMRPRVAPNCTPFNAAVRATRFHG